MAVSEQPTSPGFRAWSPVGLADKHNVCNEDGMCERCRVLHLVHAWHQQGTSENISALWSSYIDRTHSNFAQDLINPSSDINAGGPKTATVAYYFKLTKPMHAYIAEMFKALFPAFYHKYKEAFKAGQWVPEDNRPFLG
jgi:hypothetical protein